MLTNKEVDFHFQMDSNDELKKKNVSWSRLVVPLRMRSKYWKYFGFPADERGNIVCKDKIVCLLCKFQMIYNRNTSNLRMHLVSKHKNLAKQVDPDFVRTLGVKGKPSSSTPKKKSNIFSQNSDGTLNFQETTPLVGSTSSSSKKNADKNATREVHLLVPEQTPTAENDVSNIAIIFPQDELVEYTNNEETEESSEVYNALMKFVVTDLVPPSILDGKGFRELIWHLSPKSMFISYEKKLTNDVIPNMMQMTKEKMNHSIMSQSITNISLSIEEWMCVDRIKCLSIYVHYIQSGNATVQTKLITTIDMTGIETSDYWNLMLDNVFQEWGLNSNDLAAVSISTSNENLIEVLKEKNLIVMPCLLRVIQVICDKYIFNHREVRPLLEKCRKIIKFVKDNQLNLVDEFCVNNANDEDEEEEVEEEDIDYPLNVDHEHFWLTTYFMLRNLSRKKNSFNEAIQSMDSYIIPSIAPTVTEWKHISDLVSLLEPFKIVIITIFEEKYPLASLVKPLIWKLATTKFDVNHSDSAMLVEMKRNIRKDLNQAYTDCDVHNFTKIATILDPRFKAFVEADDGCNTSTVLIDLLKNFMDVEGGLTLTSPRTIGTPSKKQGRSSGINALFGDISTPKSSMSSSDKIKTEVTHYQSVNSPSLDESPLEWWRQMMSRCPNLSKLAYKYHCVPSILAHGEGNILDYLKFCQKRSGLNVNIAHQILFLHHNQSA